MFNYIKPFRSPQDENGVDTEEREDEEEAIKCLLHFIKRLHAEDKFLSNS